MIPFQTTLFQWLEHVAPCYLCWDAAFLMLKDMLNGTVDKSVSGASVARPVVPRFSSRWHQRKLKVVVCFHLLHPRRYASDEQPRLIRSADDAEHQSAAFPSLEIVNVSSCAKQLVNLLLFRHDYNGHCFSLLSHPITIL